MGRKDKLDSGDKLDTDAPADDVGATWAEKNSSGFGASSKPDDGQPSSPEAETKPLDLPKPPSVPKLAPPDRREEQAIRNMTPLGASHSIKPTSKAGEPLAFSSRGDKLAHTLQRARDWMLERNAHLGSATLLSDMETAIAEYTGADKPEPLSRFAPSGSSTSSSSASDATVQETPSANLAVP